jgi:hypothetical protein
MMTIPDITGDNAVHQIVLPAPARWVQFAAVGTGTLRVGGPGASAWVGSATQGTPVSAGPNAGFMAPFMGQFSFYQVNEFTAYVPTGVTLSVGAKE